MTTIEEFDAIVQEWTGLIPRVLADGSREIAFVAQDEHERRLIYRGPILCHPNPEAEVWFDGELAEEFQQFHSGFKFWAYQAI